MPRNSLEHAVSACAILGPAHPLPTADLGPFSLLAKTEAVLLRVPQRTYLQVMDTYQQFLRKERRLQFIESSVPGAKAMGRLGRQRILDLTHKVTFQAGQVLLREHEIASCVYLIYSGECVLTSTHQPPLPCSFGTSLDTLQYSVATRGQWVGEASVLLEQPMNFSVTAKTCVEALRISSKAFVEEFPRSSMLHVVDSVQQKQQMWQARRAEVGGVLAQLSRDQSEYIKTVRYTQQHFPQATKAAQASLRKLTLKQHAYDSTLMLNTPMFRKARPLTRKPKTRLVTHTPEPQPNKSFTPERTILASASTFFSRLRPVYTASSRRGLPSRPTTPCL